MYAEQSKQLSIKKISKRKSTCSWCRDGSTNALAEKVHKQEVPCTQWYALHTMTTLFNNHTYISSNGIPVATKFTPTYVGMVVEYQLDLEIFYGDFFWCLDVDSRHDEMCVCCTFVHCTCIVCCLYTVSCLVCFLEPLDSSTHQFCYGTHSSSILATKSRGGRC